MAVFEMSGIQFLCVRIFTVVWGLSKNMAVLSYLVLGGVGSVLGLYIGPKAVKKRGGGNTPLGVVHSLKILGSLSVVHLLGLLWGLVCLYGKMRSTRELNMKVQADTWGLMDIQLGDVWLWMTWASILAIWSTRNACLPTLAGINLDVMPHKMRSMQHCYVIGFASGPLVPGLLMPILSMMKGWEEDRVGGEDAAKALMSGMAFVLFANLADYFVLGRAFTAATEALDEQRDQALKELRKAFEMENIDRLERAVAFARRVELQTHNDGEAVLGMANQAIGEFKAAMRTSEPPVTGKMSKGSRESRQDAQSKAFQGALAVTGSRQELHKRVLDLQCEVAQLKAENEKLQETLDSDDYVAIEASVAKSSPPLEELVEESPGEDREVVARGDSSCMTSPNIQEVRGRRHADPQAASRGCLPCLGYGEEDLMD
jgi:hypothetical protein